MKDNSILNKVRELLGMEVKLAERRLEDGQTRIEAEEFAAGFQVVIVTEDDQRIPMPEGEYKLDGEEGEILVIKEEGIIFEIKKEEVVEEEVVEEEVEVKDDVVEEEMNAEKPVKKTVESIVKETFFSEIEALKKENEELKAEVEHLSKINNKTEMSETKEDVKEEVELSNEPSTKPITHNPENEQKTNLIAYGQRRPQTTLDRVFAKLSK
ncbi:hypothetical protein [uncultured Mediterranean phage uvDeep-CGR1-KM17-C101]|nr:hypothetical protein [uncultured Mediterranean phage uvDeep-CGR1-KM17-C101]